MLEVAIGGHRADADLLRQLADGHRFGSMLGEQSLGRVAQALAKIGDVVVGKGSRHKKLTAAKKALARVYSVRHKFTT